MVAHPRWASHVAMMPEPQPRSSATPRGGPPDDYARLVHNERARWLRVVRTGNVQVD